MHGVLCNTKSLAIKHTHDFTPKTEQIDMETISEADKRFTLHSHLFWRGFFPDCINIKFSRLAAFFDGTTTDTVLAKVEDINMME